MNITCLRIFLIVLTGHVLTQCSPEQESKKNESMLNADQYEAVAHKSLAHSTLQIPIDYPVGDLQSMINRIMPDTLVNDSIDLNDKGDYLVLKILPIGELLLSGYQNYLDASIPVKGYAHVRKKVAAFNIKNKNAIEFELRLDLHTELAVNEEFNLSTSCKIQQVKWIKEPAVKVLGIKFNLKNTVDKQLEKNAYAIERAICKAIDEVVPVQKEVKAIWQLLNKTHRIAKKPVDIWLSTTPEEFSAQFEKKVEDTLRVVLHAKTGVIITPLKGVKSEGDQPLPSNKNIKDTTALDLTVSVVMPYLYMNKILESQLEGHNLQYAGITIALKDFSTTAENEHLKLACAAYGDVEANLVAQTQPSLNEERALILGDITYEIDSDNPIVNSIDWISGSSLDSYLSDNSKIPLSHILDSLDFKIIQALNRSDLGSKINLNLNFNHIEPDTVIYHQDRFEWVFTVKGQAHAFLTDHLVQNKSGA